MPRGIYQQSKEWRIKKSGKNNPFFGKTHTKETRDRIVKALTGKRLTDEQRERRKEIFVGFSNLGTFKKGLVPWNTGKKASPGTIEKLRKSHLGQKAWNKGIHYEAISGEKNNNWKGGISTENDKIRQSLEYKFWQDSVKMRDGKCMKCGEIRVSKTMAHHILNFSSHKDLRFVIDNGITLCRPCHREFHKRYTTKNNTREQVVEFLSSNEKSPD